MTVMERDLDRALKLLRDTIRERGYTQLEVQECLGWGRSHIPQILKRKRSLRLTDLFQILDVVGADRMEFFTELLEPRVSSSRVADYGPN